MKSLLFFLAGITLCFNVWSASDAAYETPLAHKLDHLAVTLHLTPEQKEKIDAIFKEQHEKFAAIHKESHDRVTAILSPEQARLWEEMRAKHQAELQKKGQP
jgi:periplasmic protein CpxP/Spy